MKTCLFLTAFLYSLSGLSQIVNQVQYRSEADKKIYVSPYKSEASLYVYETKFMSEALPNSGIWYFSKFMSEAFWKIYFVKYRSEADIIVYFTKYRSEAGWRK